MAEENESLRLGVEFDGAPGVNQFLGAMGVIPGRLDSLFGQVAAAGGNETAAWARKGQEVVRAYYAAAQAEMAGFRGVGGDNLVDSVMKSAGLTTNQMREMRGVLTEISRTQRETQSGAFGSRDFDQAAVLGLTGAKRTVAEVSRATEELNRNLDRSTRQLETLRGVSTSGVATLATPADGPARRLLSANGFGGQQWTKFAREQAESSGLALPTAPQGVGIGQVGQLEAARVYDQAARAQLGVAEQQLRELRDQHQRLKNAPIMQETPEAVRSAMAPVVRSVAPEVPTPRVAAESGATPREQEIARLRSEGVNGRTLTGMGYSRGEVRRVEEQYPGLIQSIQAETAARQEAARAARAASGARLGEMWTGRDNARPGIRDARENFDSMWQEQLSRAFVGRAPMAPGMQESRLAREAQDQAFARGVENRFNPGGDARLYSGQRDQFDTREQPYAPSPEYDRLMNEVRNVLRGGPGFGPNGLSPQLVQRLTTDEGVMPVSALRPQLEQWQRQQAQGSLFDQRRGYERIWEQMPETSTERQYREQQEAMRSAAQQRLAAARVDGSALTRSEFATVGDERLRVAQGRVNQNFRPNLNLGPDEGRQGTQRLAGERATRNLYDFMQTELPRATAAAQRERQAASRSGTTEALGGQYGLGAQFRRGFGGPQDAPMGEMVGQTARIALMYGAAYRVLNLLQMALADMTREALEFEEALTDLAVATNRSRADSMELATTLGETAAQAGYGSSEGARMGAKSIGLFGVAQASVEEQDRTAEISTRVATQVARTAGSDDPEKVQVQLAGAARSFGYGVDRLTDIQDAITYISRNTGQAPTELLGATSNIATLGRSSGFSPEQLMAIVAQVGTTTGQNPEGTAGQFRQVLSREFDLVAKSAREIFGIDTREMTNTEQVIDAVSKIQGRTQTQTNDFTATFGKGGSQTVAMITLENWDTIQGLSQGAQGATGVGEDTFNVVMNNVGQQLRLLGTEASNLGLKLVQTGVIDWIVLVIGAADAMVGVLTTVVDMFNEIPRPLRSVAFALAEILIVSRLLAASGMAAAASARLGMLGNARGAGIAGRAGAGALAVGNIWTSTAAAAARGREGLADDATRAARARAGAAGVGAWALQGSRNGINAARGFGMVGGLDPADRAAERDRLRAASARGGFGGRYDEMRANSGLTGGGMAVAAVAAGAAVLQVAEGFQNLVDSSEALADAQRQSALAITESQYLDAAAAARAAADEARGNTLGGLESDITVANVMSNFMNLIPATIGSLAGGSTVNDLEDLAAENERRAAEVAARQSAEEAARPSSAFRDLSSAGLEETLKSLTDRGYTARQQLEMLNEAFFQFSEVATKRATAGIEAVVSRPQFDTFAGDLSANVGSSITKTAEWQQGEYDTMRYGSTPFFAGRDSTEAERNAAQDAAEVLGDTDRIAEVQGAVRDSVLAQLEGLSSDQLALFTDADIAELTDSAKAAVQGSFSDQEWEELGKGVQDTLLTFVEADVRRSMAGYGAGLSAANVGGYLKNLPGLAASAGEERTRAGGSEVEGARAQLSFLEAGIGAVEDLGALSVFSDVDKRLLELARVAAREAKREYVNVLIDDINYMATLRANALPESDVTGRLAAALAGSQSAQQAADDAYYGSMQMDYSQGYPQATFDSQLLKDKQAADQAALDGQRAIEANELAKSQSSLVAGVDPADSIGMAAVQLANAQSTLASLDENEAAWFDAQAAVKNAQLNLTQTQIQGINAAALARVDPRDVQGRISQQVANAQRERALYPVGDPRRGALDEQLAQLGQQGREARVGRANAYDLASVAGAPDAMAQAQVAAGNAARSLGAQLPGTEAYANALAELRNAQFAVGQASVDNANALAQANISGLSSQLASSRVGVESAQRTLGLQLPGTTAFYESLSGLRQAQAQLAEQERTQADRVRRLSSDLTDPLAQARLDTQQALETYWANQGAGEGEDVLAQNQLDLRGAQNREEAAMFSQRLSDTQVAEDLGRISHSQYMSYLQSEHDRLAAIGTKTRQQQDQLNQIDQLMKSAAEEMQGQWNIGDIELPSIYEVRRAIGAGSPTAVSDYSNSNNTVNINGADFAQVVDWVTRYMGTGAQVVMATTPRR